MRFDWGQVVLTVAVAAATSLVAIGATVGLQPTGLQVRRYLLAHPEVIPEAMTALQARDTGKVVAANRAAIVRPVGDAWIGNPAGDVTLVEYFDYNCGYCRASLSTITALVQADPKLRVVFRELPILSQASYDAAKVSYAAARTGRFRAFHDPLYRAGPITPESLAATTRTAGIAPAAVKQYDAAATAEIKGNIALARQLQMSGTPSWVVGDQVISGLRPIEELQAAIKAARGG